MVLLPPTNVSTGWAGPEVVGVRTGTVVVAPARGVEDDAVVGDVAPVGVEAVVARPDAVAPGPDAPGDVNGLPGRVLADDDVASGVISAFVVECREPNPMIRIATATTPTAAAAIHQCRKFGLVPAIDPQSVPNYSTPDHSTRDRGMSVPEPSGVHPCAATSRRCVASSPTRPTRRSRPRPGNTCA